MDMQLKHNGLPDFDPGVPPVAESLSPVLTQGDPSAPPGVEDLSASVSNPEEDGDEAKLEWYAVADEYWKEYLNDLARKAVIEKMVR